MNILDCFVGSCGQDDKAVDTFNIIVDTCQIDWFARQLEEILVLA